MRFFRIASAVAICLAGCSSVPMPPGLKPYKIDIQQGNVITQDMVAKLKPGMTKAQVRFALGTPLIVDAFHADRWDYVYRLEKGGKLIENRKITAVFDDDKLNRIEGDVIPAQPGQAAAPGAPSSPAANVAGSAPEKQDTAEEKAKEEKGFFGRMREKLGF